MPEVCLATTSVLPVTRQYAGDTLESAISAH